MKYTDRGDEDEAFWVHSLDQEICVYVRVTLCRPEKWCFSLSLLFPLYQGNTLSLPNVVNYPHCFITACKSLWRLGIIAGTLDSKTQTYSTNIIFLQHFWKIQEG